MNTATLWNYLKLLESSIAQRNVLLLGYRSSANGVRSEREIDPWGIYFAQGQWMLVAFCRLRNEKRTFRLDGILSLEKTATEFPPHQFSFD